MDPNVALTQIRDAVGVLARATDGGAHLDPAPTRADVIEAALTLVEAWDSLDGWLSSDGFLPTDWLAEEDK